ncbi:MAG: GTPase HflX, partial [Gammaproteobacteria bacterium]
MSGAWQANEARDAAVVVHPELIAARKGPAAWDARAEEFLRLVDAGGCDVAAAIRLPVR